MMICINRTAMRGRSVAQVLENIIVSLEVGSGDEHCTRRSRWGGERAMMALYTELVALDTLVWM